MLLRLFAPFNNKLSERVPGKKVHSWSLGSTLFRRGMPCFDHRNRSCWIETVYYVQDPDYPPTKRPTMPIVVLRYRTSQIVRELKYYARRRRPQVIPLYLTPEKITVWSAATTERIGSAETSFPWRGRIYRLGEIVAAGNRLVTIAQIIPSKKPNHLPEVIVRAPRGKVKRMEQLYRIDLRNLRNIIYDDVGLAWVAVDDPATWMVKNLKSKLLKKLPKGGC